MKISGTRPQPHQEPIMLQLQSIGNLKLIDICMQVFLVLQIFLDFSRDLIKL